MADFLSQPSFEINDGFPFRLSLRKMLLFGSISAALPYTKPLLAVARRYEVPPDDELTQVAWKTGLGSPDEIIKVGLVWMFDIRMGMFY